MNERIDKLVIDGWTFEPALEDEVGSAFYTNLKKGSVIKVTPDSSNNSEKHAVIISYEDEDGVYRLESWENEQLWELPKDWIKTISAEVAKNVKR
jgi:hypothetical protein